MGGATTATPNDGLATEHARLLADGNTQFALPSFVPPVPPEWAIALGKWLRRHAADFAALAPVVKYAFWGGLAILLLFLGWSLWRWLAPRLTRTPADEPATGWRPEAAPARALLAEADALAARGDFAAAARLVLLRSVEQIESQRRDRIAPALTSRDIARSPALPGDVARAFGLIADVVEEGLFARRAVGAEAWTRARSAYEAVAFPRAWA